MGSYLGERDPTGGLDGRLDLAAQQRRDERAEHEARGDDRDRVRGLDKRLGQRCGFLFTSG
jgi:hypothetical protein